MKGIDVYKLKPGTMILVQTKNTTYKFAKAERLHEVIVQGGKYLPQPLLSNFTGSPCGPILQLGWIAIGMPMEMYIIEYGGSITTSRVRRAKLFGLDWEYEL